MEHFRLHVALPPAAAPALAIVRTLTAAGHQAVFAGGCVRDLLLGAEPQDYDIATAAPPDRVVELFRATRKVGAQFGVVLVKKHGRWVEVATFRSDLAYEDGRRPTGVVFSDDRRDAERRDFTVNGMFLDPLAGDVLDYVRGRADLAARVIRAIGDPAARFAEDYLRLLRAVRFAARLDFALEPQTAAALRAYAAKLAHVAPERVREELAKMLAHPTRARAWRLLAACELLPHLWPGAAWNTAQAERVGVLVERLPDDAPFVAALATMLADHTPAQIEQLARDLTLSNNEREHTLWLVQHQAALDAPDRPTVAELKLLMAHPAFDVLRMLAEARYQDGRDAAQRQAVLGARCAGVAPEAVRPPPLVTGDDLLARRVTPGPVYARVLEALYTRQLNEELHTRAEALAALEALLEEVRPGQEDER